MSWYERVEKYLLTLKCPKTGLFPSVAGQSHTLYGTVYGWQTLKFLGSGEQPPPQVFEWILENQEPETGLFRGPELTSWKPAPGNKHDELHLLRHLTLATLPFLLEHGVKPKHDLSDALQFCNQESLARWLASRDWSDAWFEGNNLLFIGLYLLYLRDYYQFTEASAALERWFVWLDSEVDPATGMWGTDKGSSVFNGMCGAYHQYLVYYQEERPLQYPRKIVDNTLALQHPDGGFSPSGWGGACEDVDAVDILVNQFKLNDYRRSDIKFALARCRNRILSSQNPDGGFSYRHGEPGSHMGLPATEHSAYESAVFPTWFRIHTLALIAEILPSEKTYGFNSICSMGWHKNPNPEYWNAVSRNYHCNVNMLISKSFKYKIFLARSIARRVKQRILPLHL